MLLDHAGDTHICNIYSITVVTKTISLCFKLLQKGRLFCNTTRVIHAYVIFWNCPFVPYRHALLTDFYLQVKNSNGHIYAMGDCSTIEQKKLLSNVKEIFTEADKDGDGKLDLEEFKGIYTVLTCTLLYFTQ